MTINLSTLVNYSTKVCTDEIGVNVAPLDNQGLVPSANLPSYVDDVLEFADLASFPSVGDTGVIYIAIDTNTDYRWSGSVYVAIGQTPNVIGIGATAFVRFDASQSLSGANQIQARSNLGLGSAATTASTDYLSAASGRFVPATNASTAYTIEPSDFLDNGRKYISFTSSSPTTITVNSSSLSGVAVGQSLSIFGDGTGTFTIAGSGITVIGSGAFTKIYEGKTIIVEGSGTIRIVGAQP